jgi:hypothetical protein
MVFSGAIAIRDFAFFFRLFLRLLDFLMALSFTLGPGGSRGGCFYGKPYVLLYSSYAWCTIFETNIFEKYQSTRMKNSDMKVRP